MNAVGIDVSKGKSMVAALRPMGEVALLPQEFLHTEVGLEQMAYAIIALGEDTRVVMEATGRYTIKEGQPITFMLDENTVATHRVVGIVPDEEDPTVIRFRTKGDANEAEDGSLVHYKNVIGTPIFSIPYLGYIADYIQHPPGMYIAISAGAVLLLLVFIPDIFADGKDEDESKKKKSSRRKKGAHAAAHKAAAVDVTPEEPADESLTDEIRRKTDNLLTDDEVEAIRQTVEAGRFDKAAADALRQELIKREAERDAQ